MTVNTARLKRLARYEERLASHTSDSAADALTGREFAARDRMSLALIEELVGLGFSKTRDAAGDRPLDAEYRRLIAQAREALR